ncbi:MAG: P-type conjugative transfer protein TrbL, partial [Sphingorhabdus sp.]
TATAHGGAKAAGGATMAYSLGSAGKSGPGAVASGIGAVSQAAGGAAMSPLRKSAEGLQQSFKDGARSAIGATGGKIISPSSGLAPGASPPADPAPTSGPPAWARAMKDRQAILHSAQIAAHTLKSGDGGGAGTTIDSQPKE